MKDLLIIKEICTKSEESPHILVKLHQIKGICPQILANHSYLRVIAPRIKGRGPLRTNIYVRIISVLLLVTQETELCL